jgi:CheY-like chemotaxis protein
VKGIDKQVPQLVEDDNLLANLDFLPAMILLVDDLPFNRQLIKAYLADFKELRIIEAETGDYALSLLRQCHFDLILMDKRLPDEDGESVCRKMKALPKCATIPIIMVTASVLAVTESEFPPAYDLQLDKPVNKKQLLMAMQSFLRTKLRPQTVVTPVVEVATPVNSITSAQVEALYTLLKTDYQAQIAALNNPEILQIDELIDMAEQLINLAEQYSCHLLHDWAETLKKQAELFDLSNLPETLTHFEQLLTQLHDYLQANSL